MIIAGNITYNHVLIFNTYLSPYPPPLQHESLSAEECAAVGRVSEAVSSGVASLSQLAGDHCSASHSDLASLSLLATQHTDTLRTNTEVYTCAYPNIFVGNPCPRTYLDILQHENFPIYGIYICVKTTCIQA